MANRWGKNGNSDRLYLFWWAPKSLWMLTAAMKLKDTCSLEQKLWQTSLSLLVAKSCPTLATPWTDCQAPLSMGFSRQEYWGGLPFPSPEDLPNPGIEPRSPIFPSPGDLPNPGIEPRSPILQADSLPAEPPGLSTTHIHNSYNCTYNWDPLSWDPLKLGVAMCLSFDVLM